MRCPPDLITHSPYGYICYAQPIACKHSAKNVNSLFYLINFRVTYAYIMYAMKIRYKS